MELKALPTDVISKLRSGVAIVSIAHCMEELVLNALDAGATCVAVRLNLPYHKVQVVDNGHGMSKEQLYVCGERYSTSKCRTLSDLDHPKFYGYRGEAVASLVEMSGMLQIESRATGSDESYCKIFTRGHMQELSRSSSERPSVGTTFTVLDFMFNLPVRRSSVSETIDFEFCLQLLEGLSLGHPRVSFTLRDDITGEMRFQTHKSSSVLETFSQLFGKRKAASLRHATLTKKKFAVDAYLSMEGHTTRCLQFAYLNKRLLVKTRIHKLFHNVLKKYVLRSQTQPGLPTSPTKLRNKHPVFVVFVKCLTKTYDITFEPRKTLVEFANWDAVTRAFECLLNGFLCEHKLINHSFVFSGDLPFSQKTTPEQAEGQSSTKKVYGDISVDEVPNVLVSMKAYRNRCQNVDSSKGNAKAVPEMETIIECLDDDEEPPSIISEGSQSMETGLTSGKSSVEKERSSLIQELGLRETSIMLPLAFPNSSQNRVQLRLPKNTSFIDIAHRFRFDRRDKQIQNSKACKDKRQLGRLHCSMRVPGSTAGLSSSRSMQKKLVPESVDAPTARSPTHQDSGDTQIPSNSEIVRRPMIPPLCLPVCNPTPLATKLRRRMTKIANRTLDTDRSTAQQVLQSYFVDQQEPTPNQRHGLTGTPATAAPTYPCTTESFLNTAQDVLTKKVQAHARPSTTETSATPSKISRVDREDDAPDIPFVSALETEAVLQAQQVEASQPFVITQEFDVSHLRRNIGAEEEASASAEYLQPCNVVQLGTDSHRDSSASTPDDAIAVAEGTLSPFVLEDWSPEPYSVVQEQVLDNRLSKETCSVIQCGQSPKDTPVHTAQSFLQCSTLGFTNLNFESCTMAGHKVQSDVQSGCLSRSDVDGSKESAGTSSSEQQLLLNADNTATSTSIPCAEEHSMENIETDEKLEDLTQVSPMRAQELESVSCRNELQSEVSDLRCMLLEGKEMEHVQDIQHINEHPELAGTMHASNWMAWVDPTSGQTMYINTTSGNSAFAPPPCFEKDLQEAREQTILDMTLRSLPGPSLARFPPRPQVERAQFGGSPDADQADVVDLVKVWNNPTFTRCSLQDILGAGQYNRNAGTTACYGITQSYKFTKEMLSHVKVIGQVDAKFIACLMPVCDKGMFQEDSLIVLFDQHAAHERARLEWLLENQYEDGQGSCLRSSSLKPPLNVTLDPDVARRAAVCEKELRKIGVHFGATTQQGLVLERLPSCLVERDDSERRCGRPSSIAAQAQELLREYTEMLLSTRRSAISLPKVLLDVLSSQACHGAVKFGSALDLSECRKMLGALSRCSLPFQCAHGRPSLSPIVDLRFLPLDRVKRHATFDPSSCVHIPSSLSQAPNKPNLAKLQGKIAATMI